MDYIDIKNIRLNACHGVLDFEKTTPQPFEFDISIALSLQTPGHSDRLEHTINYAEIYALVEDIATTRTYNLIECLGENICESILNFSPKIKEATVTVRKLKPPMQGDFDYVAVTITRPV